MVKDIHGNYYNEELWIAQRKERKEPPDDLEALSAHMQRIGYGPLDFTSVKQEGKRG